MKIGIASGHSRRKPNDPQGLWVFENWNMVLASFFQAFYFPDPAYIKVDILF